MDVGDPSNFIRILQLFGNNIKSINEILTAYSVSDEETKNTIKDVYDVTGYTLDPHGAVGYKALQQYLDSHPQKKGYLLGTAHPIKFYDVVEEILKRKVELPNAIQQLMTQKKQSIKIKATAEELKSFLLS